MHACGLTLLWTVNRPLWGAEGPPFSKLFSRVLATLYAGMSLRLSVRPYVRPSVRPLCLTKRGLDCSLCDRRIKIAEYMYFDVFFHMRFIPTPRNVLHPPLGGPNPSFFLFFSNSRKKKSARNKSCRSRKVDIS